MVIGEHAEAFAGLPVRVFDPNGPMDAPEHTAWAVCAQRSPAPERAEQVWSGWEQGPPPAGLDAFVPGHWGYGAPEPLWVFARRPEASRVRALVCGMLAGGDPDMETVEAHVGELGALRHLFVNDLTVRQREISWIVCGSVTSLLMSCPELETFAVRGGRMRFEGLDHYALRALTVESGGLNREAVEDIGRACLPRLERLELWLGDPGYTYDDAVDVDALVPLLSGKSAPRLRWLGLRNAANLGALLGAVLASPLMDQLRALDLSMGSLDDAMAAQLVAHPAAQRLEWLDASRSRLTGRGEALLREAFGERVVVGEQRPGDWRYCEVAE